MFSSEYHPIPVPLVRFHMVWQVTVSLTSSYSSEIVVNFKKVKRQTYHQLQGFRFFKLVKAKTLNFI